MDLIRILRREILFKKVGDGDWCHDNICGSAARNFEVHPKFGALSFFQVSGEDSSSMPALERVAMAVTVGRQKLDDVAYCLVDGDLLNSLGVEVVYDGTGATKFEDVDQHHVSVMRVTMSRLSALTLECARRVGEKLLTVVPRGRVAFEIDQAVNRGELQFDKFDTSFVNALKETRKSNHYKVAAKAFALQGSANEEG